MEQGSKHPLAQAIAAHAQAHAIALETLAEFRSIPGKGLSARIDGAAAALGSPAFAAELGLVLPEADVAALQQAGKTVIFVARAGHVLGIVGIADRLRPTTSAAIRELLALQVTPVMLTMTA